MKSKVIGLVGLALSMTLPLSAGVMQTNVVNGLMWVSEVRDGWGAVLGGGSLNRPALPYGANGDVVVPSELGGYPVVSISEYAFAHRTDMTSIVVPTNVISINSSAFMGCCALTNMVLPFVGGERTPVDKSYGSGESWSYELFGYIFGEAEVSGMTAVRQWKETTGAGKKYKTYFMPPSLESITITDEECLYRAAFYNMGMLKSIHVPPCLRKAYGDAVDGCDNLTDIHIQDMVNWCQSPQYLLDVNRNLFLNGELVKDLVIPSAVKEVAWRAFANYTNLTSVSFPRKIDIADGAFGGCSSLTNMVLPNHFAGLFHYPGGSKPSQGGLVEVNQRTDSSSTRTYYMPAGLKSVAMLRANSISAGEFDNCTMLEEIFIGGNVTNIGDYAIRNCTGLKKLVFGGNAPRIKGSHTFDNMNPDCAVYVTRWSTGWDVDIPGTWRGMSIQYLDYDEMSIDGNVPAAVDGTPYSVQLTAGGGNGPYEWQLARGSGGTVSKDGVLSIEGRDRRLVSSQSLDFTVRALDQRGVAVTRKITVVMEPVPNRTKTTPELVPYAYLDESCPEVVAAYDGDYEAVANATAGNGVNKIWECYVLGISPTNETARFTALIEVDASGTPIVKWRPDLNEDGTKDVRTYSILGRKDLGSSDGWLDVTSLPDAEKRNYRFFKVTVDMK